MNLPAPPREYNQSDIAQTRDALVREDGRNYKKGTELQFNGDSAAAGPKFVIVSANGTRYRLLVSNAGVLSTVAL